MLIVVYQLECIQACTKKFNLALKKFRWNFSPQANIRGDFLMNFKLGFQGILLVF